MHNIIQIIIQKWQAIPISLQERSNPEFFKKIYMDLHINTT